MDVNVAVPTGLQFFGPPFIKNFWYSSLLSWIEDQAALGGDQRESVLEFSFSPIYMMDWIFLVYAVQHADKILLIVAVVAVAFWQPPRTAASSADSTMLCICQI